MKRKLLCLAAMVVIILTGFSIASSYSYSHSQSEVENHGKSTRNGVEYGYPTDIQTMEDDSQEDDSDVDYFFEQSEGELISSPSKTR